MDDDLTPGPSGTQAGAANAREGGAPDALLDVLRERGAARREPVRFRFLEALARRAAAHDGAARRVLDDRLERLLLAFLEELPSAAVAVDGAVRSSTPAASAGAMASELAALVQRIGRPAMEPVRGHPLAPPRQAGEEPGALDYFRRTWARLSADQRLTQSRSSLPENAGPLHSHHLVHRALTTMRDLSPDYLERFVAYVDTLLWLEQADGGTGKDAGVAVRADVGRKTARGRS